MQRHACNPRGGSGLLSKEIHKHRFLRHGVLIRQNPHGSGFFQYLQHHARRFVLENRAIPRQTPVTIYQCIDPLVVDSPRHVVQRKSVERVCKRRKLPRADVPRQIEHAFAAPLPFQEVFMSVEHDNLLDILF